MAKSTRKPKPTAPASPSTREQGKPRAALPSGLRSLRDVAEDLKVSYIKADELAEAGPFILLSASPRTRVIEGDVTEEMAFEVQIMKDAEVFFFTPQNNATRARMAEVLKKGPVGPLTLVQGEAKPGRSAPWLFADEKGNPAY